MDLGRFRWIRMEDWKMELVVVEAGGWRMVKGGCWAEDGGWSRRREQTQPASQPRTDRINRL